MRHESCPYCGLPCDCQFTDGVCAHDCPLGDESEDEESMPTSPEGVTAILAELSRVSAEMGKYTSVLKANTQAVSELRQDVSELREDVESIKSTLAEKAIKEAEARGREQERERLRKYAHQSNDSDSGELMPTLMQAGRSPWWRELLNDRFLVAMLTLIVIVGMLILGGGGIVQVVEKWAK